MPIQPFIQRLPSEPYLEESPERDRSSSLQAEGEMELRCYKIFLCYSCKLTPLLVECKYVVGQLRKDVSNGATPCFLFINGNNSTI